MSNIVPLQLSPTQRAGVVTRHEPLGNAAPVELVAAAGHDAAPVAVLELAQADRALLLRRRMIIAATAAAGITDVLAWVRDVVQQGHSHGRHLHRGRRRRRLRVGCCRCLLMPPVVVDLLPVPASPTVVAAADGDYGDDQKSVAEPEEQSRQVKIRHRAG